MRRNRRTNLATADHAPRTRLGTRRVIRGLTAGMAVLTALVVALTPVAAATHALSIVKSPYKKTSVAAYYSESASGCGSANVTKTPVWSAATGVGKFSEKGSAATCTGFYGTQHISSSGNTFSELTVAVALHPSLLTSSIQVTWLSKWAASAKWAHVGSCPGVSVVDAYGNGSSTCSVSAYAYYLWYSYLVDTTNGTYFLGFPYPPVYMFSGGYWQSVETCVYYSCTTNTYSYGTSPVSTFGNWGNTTYINGTFNPLDHYQLISVLYSYANCFAGFYSYPSLQPGGSFAGASSASFNLGTGGHLANLTSIKLV